MAVKKSTKRSGVVVYSYFKEGAFTAVKRDEKAYLFCPKRVYNYV